jgi:hypothetical protein
VNAVQVDAVPRMMATRTVALIPTVTLAVVFEATNTFDQVRPLILQGSQHIQLWYHRVYPVCYVW